MSSCPVISNPSGNDMGVNVLLTGVAFMPNTNAAAVKTFVVHSRIHLPIVPVCGYRSLSLHCCVVSTVGDLTVVR